MCGESEDFEQSEECREEFEGLRVSEGFLKSE